MYRFYFFLWLKWAQRLTLSSLGLASVISFAVTFGMYLFQGAPQITQSIFDALQVVFLFWFPIAWGFSLLFVLFLVLKFIFNDCISGYKLQLLACDTKEPLDVLGYGDIVKVWRKWFMLLIWLVSAFMILALTLSMSIFAYDTLFEWFNIYWLYSFILLGGYFSFILLGSKCKKVRIQKC